MRRIAILSDIHGNLPALEAVLADMAAAGFGPGSERYCLGDLVGYGPDPRGVIRAIRDAGIATIPGNYDEGVAARRGSCGCYYATEQARLDGEASYVFTDDALEPSDREWLLSLPAEIRLDERDVRILLAHGSPRKINEYLLPDRTDGQLVRLATAAGADVVCHGHIHLPYHRSIPVDASGAMSAEADLGARWVHYVSSGSVGKPKDGDPRAGWVEVVFGTEGEVRAAAPDDAAAGPAGESGVWVGTLVHRVAYDVEAVAASMIEVGLPPTLAEALRRG